MAWQHITSLTWSHATNHITSLTLQPTTWHYATSHHSTSQPDTVLDTTQRPPPDGMVQHKNFGLRIALVSFLAYKVFSARLPPPSSPGNSWYLDRYTANVVWYCMNNKSRPPPIGWWLKVKTTIGHGQTQAGARTATAGFCWLIFEDKSQQLKAHTGQPAVVVA